MHDIAAHNNNLLAAKIFFDPLFVENSPIQVPQTCVLHSQDRFEGMLAHSGTLLVFEQKVRSLELSCPPSANAHGTATRLALGHSDEPAHEDLLLGSGLLLETAAQLVTVPISQLGEAFVFS